MPYHVHVAIYSHVQFHWLYSNSHGDSCELVLSLNTLPIFR